MLDFIVLIILLGIGIGLMLGLLAISLNAILMFYKEYLEFKNGGNKNERK